MPFFATRNNHERLDVTRPPLKTTVPLRDKHFNNLILL